MAAAAKRSTLKLAHQIDGDDAREGSQIMGAVTPEDARPTDDTGAIDRAVQAAPVLQEGVDGSGQGLGIGHVHR
ncbi:hypothetical protein Q3H58_005285 [Pseudomonas psychrotolerans]|nr:hypothetical protein [Pseudomonas psychrotolerans]